jgi:hypothetical protein
VDINDFRYVTISGHHVNALIANVEAEIKVIESFLATPGGIGGELETQVRLTVWRANLGITKVLFGERGFIIGLTFGGSTVLLWLELIRARITECQMGEELFGYAKKNMLGILYHKQRKFWMSLERDFLSYFRITEGEKE